VFMFETGVTLRSPGLELNDIGFMLTANEINHFTWSGFHFQKPVAIFRTARLNYNHWSRWDYGGQFLYQAFNFNSHATFTNFWQAGTGLTWNPYDVSNNALRGTTSLRRPPGIAHNVYLTSDTRKPIYVNLNTFNFWGFDNAVKGNDVGLSLIAQPFNALRVSLSGNYAYNWRRQDQYVERVEAPQGTRTIVGQVSQNTLRFTGRLTFNLTPDLTVQYYGQPFITRPVYRNFAYVTNPLARRYDDRFQAFGADQITLVGDSYEVDEDADGTAEYRFSRPDFNFVQFRSNFVVRWEYKAGSELYLVWSQGNTANAAGELDTPLAGSLWDNAFAEGSRNSFLIKWTYRFLR